MRIYMVAQTWDIYCCKLLVGFSFLGHEVAMIYHDMSNPDMYGEMTEHAYEVFCWANFGEACGKMETLAKLGERPDLCIAFGEPANMGTVCKEAFPSWHWIYCPRNPHEYEIDENRKSAADCGAVLAPSYGFCKAVGADELSSVRIRPMLPSSWLLRIKHSITPGHRTPVLKHGLRKGIVYEGGIDTEPAWRNYLPTIAQCVSEGIPFTIFQTQPFTDRNYAIIQRYLDAGADVHSFIGYFDVLNQLPYYQAGWAAGGCPEFKTGPCVTNKLFEYVAAGLMPIVDRESEQGGSCLDLQGDWIEADSIRFRDYIQDGRIWNPPHWNMEREMQRAASGLMMRYLEKA